MTRTYFNAYNEETTEGVM